VTSATKRPAMALRDDDDDDDECVKCPSTLRDQEPPEAVRRRAQQPPVLQNHDEMVSHAKSPTGSGFQSPTSSSGVEAKPPLSAYRSAVRIPAPPPSATAFQLVAFQNIYASQQEQHQLRQTQQLSPHLRFSLFTDVPSAPGIYSAHSLLSVHSDLFA